MRKRVRRRVWLGPIFILFSLLVIQRSIRKSTNKASAQEKYHYRVKEQDSSTNSSIIKDIIFDGNKFKNDTPTESYLVPNIVHYIRWNKAEYSFTDYICFRSAYINHSPQYFHVYTNMNFSGKWWERINEEKDWSSRIKIFWLEPPSEIFSQELSK
ncbi:hypothetical protein QYM36_017505, partial [Artemia franciscana]